MEVFIKFESSGQVVKGDNACISRKSLEDELRKVGWSRKLCVHDTIDQEGADTDQNETVILPPML